MRTAVVVLAITGLAVALLMPSTKALPGARQGSFRGIAVIPDKGLARGLAVIPGKGLAGGLVDFLG